MQTDSGNDGKLDDVLRLSHDFGAPDYVLGGGGNTSCKDEDTLWVKPSGTTLETIRKDDFVPMDRSALRGLYAMEPPADADEREALVKEKSLQAVRPPSTGRPSVEAPLHDSFPETFVVHTHPALVNGLTCSEQGEAAANRLFPDALWVPYTDPGYTLCIRVRRNLERAAAESGRRPQTVFLQNHGVFVAGDSPEEIHRRYDTLMARLAEAYAAAETPTGAPAVGPPPTKDRTAAAKRLLREVCGEQAAAIAVSGPFAPPSGPLSPDHIVYAKAHIFEGEPSAEALKAFRREFGYWPRVVACEDAVFGLGPSESTARLAVVFALDGARVQRLADAFGGVRYMSPSAVDFIENWEVESYRSQVAAQSPAANQEQ